ncbi:Uncharacterised protein [Bordetella pertussis]|nr:Uncharacterised protein [Bordetella pertussis]CFP60410.1 Uncharacterised protein [Bordetella pertussis]
MAALDGQRRYLASASCRRSARNGYMMKPSRAKRIAYCATSAKLRVP